MMYMQVSMQRPEEVVGCPLLLLDAFLSLAESGAMLEVRVPAILLYLSCTVLGSQYSNGHTQIFM